MKRCMLVAQAAGLDQYQVKEVYARVIVAKNNLKLENLIEKNPAETRAVCLATGLAVFCLVCGEITLSMTYDKKDHFICNDQVTQPVATLKDWLTKGRGMQLFNNKDAAKKAVAENGSMLGTLFTQVVVGSDFMLSFTPFDSHMNTVTLTRYIMEILPKANSQKIG